MLVWAGWFLIFLNEARKYMSLGLIKEYNEAWPSWFNQIKDAIEPRLRGSYISIEHIGSTSVAGMNAKPIIDMDIIIEKNKFGFIKKQLEEFGYRHLGELGIVGREAFELAKDDKRKSLPEHHLYVCYHGVYEIKKHLAFRDYLRKNEPARMQLMKLKRELELTCQTRQEYIDKKDSLVQEITAQALKEYGK
jgi:GrpB-like predicted nucleotidyltransferase (UPF0157 family)